MDWSLMSLRLHLVAGLTLLVRFVGCAVAPTPTPLPGWEDDVTKLFVEDSVLPNGWTPHLYQEDVHPQANHVHRRWSNPPAAGIVSQNIWRHYTAADAQETYNEQRRALFQPRVDAEEIVVSLRPPEEIGFESTVADEYYLACTWERWAYCSYLARYRNYVSYIRLDREAELGRLESKGLTYAEIEVVLKAVDAEFGTYLQQFMDQ